MQAMELRQMSLGHRAACTEPNSTLAITSDLTFGKFLKQA